MIKVLAFFAAAPSGRLCYLGPGMLETFVRETLFREYAPAFKIAVALPDGQSFVVKRRRVDPRAFA